MCHQANMHNDRRYYAGRWEGKSVIKPTVDLSLCSTEQRGNIFPLVKYWHDGSGHNLLLLDYT